jgi:hypothetical protein
VREREEEEEKKNNGRENEPNSNKTKDLIEPRILIISTPFPSSWHKLKIPFNSELEASYNISNSVPEYKFSDVFHPKGLHKGNRIFQQRKEVKRGKTIPSHLPFHNPCSLTYDK